MEEKMLDIRGCSCRVIMNQAKGTPIVLLHGYSFTSDSWRRTSVTELLRENAVPFLALDMPYGAKSECQPRTRNIDINVGLVKEAIQSVFSSALPVLVGASLGGHIVLQYAARFHVKGLLLLAPVRVLEEKLEEAYGRFQFPVHIIVGSKDRVASLEELQVLRGRLPNAKLTIYEGEGHSAYLGRPDKFKQDLLEIYMLATK